MPNAVESATGSEISRLKEVIASSYDATSAAYLLTEIDIRLRGNGTVAAERRMVFNEGSFAGLYEAPDKTLPQNLARLLGFLDIIPIAGSLTLRQGVDALTVHRTIAHLADIIEAALPEIPHDARKRGRAMLLSAKNYLISHPPQADEDAAAHAAAVTALQLADQAEDRYILTGNRHNAYLRAVKAGEPWEGPVPERRGVHIPGILAAHSLVRVALDSSARLFRHTGILTEALDTERDEYVHKWEDHIAALRDKDGQAKIADALASRDLFAHHAAQEVGPLRQQIRQSGLPVPDRLLDEVRNSLQSGIIR